MNAPSLPAERVSRSRTRISAAFALADPVEPPVIVWPFHYIVCGSAPEDIPDDLFSNSARMLDCQVTICERHIEAVPDDFQPYLCPYYGTGILASAFGAQMQFAPGRDPWIAGPVVETPADVATLRLPDPQRDGLMPRVLETAAFMHQDGTFPVTLTDMQSPLDELILLCGHERLYLWMYDEPAMVHDLFDLATEALIAWVKAQKAVTGEPLDVCHGEQGVWVPPGCGIWLADDEAVNLPPALYEEFIVPCYSRIFREFGGGVLHFCGNGAHLGKAVQQIEELRAINSGPMGQPENFARLQQATGGRIPLIYQEMAPADPLPYFRNLLSRLSLRGLILAPQVCDRFATDADGGIIEVTHQRTAEGRRIYDALHMAIEERQALPDVSFDNE